VAAVTNRILLGDYRVTLAGESWDALICDPPYGPSTHAGNDDKTIARFGGELRRSLSYDAWAPRDVREFVSFVAPRTRSWLACMTSDDLIPSYRAAFRRAGLLSFAPVPIIQPRVRLGGDGPASCAIYLMTARPRQKRFLSWGALPGWYYATIDRDGYIGGKPLKLMRLLVEHYSRPGDTVCDPCAGWGTTPIAARAEGRSYLASEMDPAAFEVARARLEEPLPLFAAAQTPLFNLDD
jgi:hypothetical protein